MNTIRTPKKEQDFLDALADACNVRHACSVADIARSSAYLWRQEDAEFAKRWDKALEVGAEALEDEAVRRAREGWEEPIYYQGTACGTVRKYSDTLLIFLLKGAKPDKYRDNAKVELGGSLNVTDLSDDEIAAKLAAYGVTVPQGAKSPTFLLGGKDV